MPLFLWVNKDDQAVFTKNLAIMLRSGMSISEALLVSGEQVRGGFKKAIEAICGSVLAGNSFSSSLKRYPGLFSELYMNTIAAGELSGNLENNLDLLAGQLKKDKEFRSKVTGALIYPAMVVLTAILIGGMISLFVLPKIIPLFEGMRLSLPLSTRILIWFTHAVEGIGPYHLIIFLGALLIMTLLLKSAIVRPFTHLITLQAPFARKMIRNYNLAVISRTMGMLLKSGFNIDEALRITRQTIRNFYYRQSLEQAGNRARKGAKLHDSLDMHKKYFPPLFINMVKVGEKSGNLEEAFYYLTEFYEAEVDNSAKSLSMIIEPVLLIIIGFAVGFLAISIITPIYQITGSVY